MLRHAPLSIQTETPDHANHEMQLAIDVTCELGTPPRSAEIETLQNRRKTTYIFFSLDRDGSFPKDLRVNETPSTPADATNS